jgi:hypothetical protein
VNYTKQGVDTANDQFKMLLPLYAQMYGQGLGAAGSLAASVYGTDIGAGTSLVNAANTRYGNQLQTGASLANTAADVFKSQLSAGTNLAGLSENSYRDYFNAAAGANQRDVGNYNNFMADDYRRTQGILKDQEARTQQAAQANRQLELDNMMKLVSNSQNMSGGQFGAGGTRQGLLTYLQSLGMMKS